MKSYEVLILKRVTYEQLVVVEDCASFDDAEIEAMEEIDDYEWEPIEYEVEIDSVEEV